MKRYRIVLTGGPGGGKTTAADLFRREIGERVVIVPEAATLLFAGGFPRVNEESVIRATQMAIYHVQRNLEEIQASIYPKRILLCDRGTIDSAAYWPEQPERFFELVGTSLEDELKRYDAVLFFESAAVGGIQIEGGNPIRNESISQAAELDEKLRKLWSQHPRFTMIPHNPSFFQKITNSLASLQKLTTQLDQA
jgi:predicted ATPase